MFKPSMILLLVFAFLIIGYSFIPNDDDYVNLSSANSNSIEDENLTEIPSKTIFVYVTGAVNKPGMVELSSSKDNLRVADAVNACDGLLPTADIDNFNMAETISDGQHIRIPEKVIKSIESDDENISTNSSNKESKINDTMVNINTANLEELQTLKGIGPKMAERIIEYRHDNGLFKSIEEIQNVRGIGQKKFDIIKSNIKI